MSDSAQQQNNPVARYVIPEKRNQQYPSEGITPSYPDHENRFNDKSASSQRFHPQMSNQDQNDSRRYNQGSDKISQQQQIRRFAFNDKQGFSNQQSARRLNNQNNAQFAQRRPLNQMPSRGKQMNGSFDKLRNNETNDESQYEQEYANEQQQQQNNRPSLNYNRSNGCLNSQLSSGNFDLLTSSSNHYYKKNNYSKASLNSTYNNDTNLLTSNPNENSRPSNPRWKNNDASSSYNHQRYDASSYSTLNQKPSATGTNWDIRDGRMWNSESVEDVFGAAKETKSTGINFDSYDSIPVELTGDGAQSIAPLLSFKEALNMHPLLQKNITRVDYEKPTPVQKHSIPVILAGRDLMACAQTGSGKTAGFLLPILSKMLTTGPPARVYNNYNKGRRQAHPVTLILSPTRELAVQIYKESRKFAFNTGIQTVVVYGGSDHTTQQIALQKGCDICVATPGRLSEFASKNTVKLDLVKFFVLDEADRMLDMGFVQQIHSIAARLPSSSAGRQTIMFSATFPHSIQTLAAEYLNKYIFLTVGRVGSTNNFISQNFIYAQENDKARHLISVLKQCKNSLVLIFVETKRKADLIKEFLSRENFAAIALHGDKSQSERERALSYFRSGERHILVATDVAARGLDIYNIEYVINLDLPSRIEDYVHRIGRTGRAGNYGKATSFVNETNKPILRDLLLLLQEADQEIPKWLEDLVRYSVSFKSNVYNRKPTFHNNYYHQNNNYNNNSYTGHNVGFNSRDARCNNSSQKEQNMPSHRFGYNSKAVDDDEDGW